MAAESLRMRACGDLRLHAARVFDSHARAIIFISQVAFSESSEESVTEGNGS